MREIFSQEASGENGDSGAVEKVPLSPLFGKSNNFVLAYEAKG
jgi:hypothetical protein